MILFFKRESRCSNSRVLAGIHKGEGLAITCLCDEIASSDTLIGGVLPGQPFVRRAASKFKTVPSVTLSNLTELMKAGRSERQNQPSLAKSNYRGPCH